MHRGRRVADTGCALTVIAVAVLLVLSHDPNGASAKTPRQTAASMQSPQSGLPTVARTNLIVAAQRRLRLQRVRYLHQPTQRAQRRASRYKYSHLNARAARRVDERAFHLGAQAWHALGGEPGDHVKRYLGNYGAVIADHSGARHVVLSTLPLDITSGKQHRLLSMRLRARHGLITPAVATVPVKIATALGLGIQLPDGISVHPDGWPNAVGQIVGAQAFFPNTATDTDFSVQPLPTGFETFWELRSRLSPESYKLALTLPAGVSLQPSHQYPGGAQIMKGTKRLYIIFPPSAKDADGTVVPTYYQIDGSNLLVHVEHRAAEVHYPIQVDPSFYGEYLYGGPNTSAGNWPWWQISGSLGIDVVRVTVTAARGVGGE